MAPESSPRARWHGTYPDVVKAEAEFIAGYASVSITAQAPNNAPLAVDDAYSVDENATLTVGAPGVLANDSDADDNLPPRNRSR